MDHLKAIRALSLRLSRRPENFEQAVGEALAGSAVRSYDGGAGLCLQSEIDTPQPYSAAEAFAHDQKLAATLRARRMSNTASPSQDGSSTRQR
jgi:hypothetical protein